MNNYKCLNLSSINYDSEDLLNLCSEKILNNSTPAWERSIYEFIREWLDDKDFINIKTSGSTGKPRTLSLKKAWMAYSAKNTCDYFRLNNKSNALLCLPASYIAGRMMIVRAFVSGCNLILKEPSGRPFKDLPISIDFAAITPFQLYQSLEDLGPDSTVKKLIVGGGEISYALERKIQKLPVDIYATYGMTETSSHIALRRTNGKEKSDMYTVLGETKISADENSCLVIENPRLFDGVLKTNDVVEIVSDNQFRWKGRYDNIINSGGLKIQPEELENSISQIISVNFAISSVPDDRLGERVVLVLEQESIAPEEEKKLLDEIKKAGHSYSLPARIFCIPVFPETPTGKINRPELRRIINKMS